MRLEDDLPVLGIGNQAVAGGDGAAQHGVGGGTFS